MASSSTPSTSYDYLILIPSYNEGPLIPPFLRQLDTCLSQIEASFMVVFIDDASTDDTRDVLTTFSFSKPSIVLKTLHLPWHRGQQGAIRQGLDIVKSIKCKRFIVMQANGEDHPEAIPELIKVRNEDIVIVNKGPRTENKTFWLIYRFYQSFFRLLTGREINWGIYSLINRKTLNLLIQGAFIHYTSRLSRLPLRRTSIRFEKKMKKTNFKTAYNNLFSGSVRSFMEFGEDLLTIFIKSSLLFGFLFFAATVVGIYLHFFQDMVLPGWTYILLLGLFNGLFLSIGFFAIGTMSLRTLHDQAKVAVVEPHEATEKTSRRREKVASIRKPLSLN